ncbi:FixH family protein [Domibacillus epiphyticus]|uniref:YtkA-like domain-containing protein n=1 Tax=Domibacillus epiphyticus TaxID=1714355 RepID=A0A1V2A8D8_9BACI|nr:FixH family protein [Domibacillus epiphyticus]OMP67122.1 hypothetical protein BTO28_09080 [Domibacillus epiphyticus]
MKKYLALLFIGIILVLSACIGEEKKENTVSTTEPVHVELTVPAKAPLNEAVEMTATVTQSGEAVGDADEVKYEIWKDGVKEDSEMIEAESEGKGVYSIKKTFSEEALYHVQVHVTARGLHTMPKAPIAIGDAAVPAETKNNKKIEHHHEN